MDNRTEARETLRQLYLFCRKTIKFCKGINSDHIIKSNIISTISKKSMTIKELADDFDVNHSWMSATISELEEKDIVSKKPKKDTRYRTIVLTAKGKNILEKIYKMMDVHTKMAFKDLTTDEIVQLRKLANKVSFDYKIPENPDVDYFK